ncbi:hypothetical protein AXF42_Ash010347 [Apostasia shenzhenica]|uniref:Transcriptional adapter 1 n=1 Tax=Apostasia shenzhenica TaxID=1088818 RepID=A0A2I0BDT2_9ASPA|nr:hypothetical protein AXF42_Ash010347 [Apostasia shenzhenica]
MPLQRQLPRVDTLGLKSHIFKKLGRQKAEKYFFNLNRFLNLKLSRMEFEKLCYHVLGKENIHLHNFFIRSILSNACFSHGPPSRQAATGHSRNSKSSNEKLGDIFPLSPRKGRPWSNTSHDLRFNDHQSPLGPLAKLPSGNVTEVANSYDVQRSQQCGPEVISIGSKVFLEVASVEDGEEVEQVRGSPSVQSRSPLRAPLGIGLTASGFNHRSLRSCYASLLRLPKPEMRECCGISSMLPDMDSLKKHLEHKLQSDGLCLSVDYANLLNHALDAYLKSVIKPCLDLARARSGKKSLSRANERFQHGINGSWPEEDARRSNQCYSATLVDFKVAMQLNPQLLGVGRSFQLDKIVRCSSND